MSSVLLGTRQSCGWNSSLHTTYKSCIGIPNTEHHIILLQSTEYIAPLNIQYRLFHFDLGFPLPMRHATSNATTGPTYTLPPRPPIRRVLSCLAGVSPLREWSRQDSTWVDRLPRKSQSTPAINVYSAAEPIEEHRYTYCTARSPRVLSFLGRLASADLCLKTVSHLFSRKACTR